jgi:predicted nuclease of restriction endonuclease-like (RecB) superfamily
MDETKPEGLQQSPMQESFTGYGTFLERIKQSIRAAQMRANLAVNRELIELYWHLGREIVLRQTAHGWGDGVLPQLAKDLQAAFPGISGFSRTNLYRVRALYLAYPETSAIVPQAVGQTESVLPLLVAQIPWAHNTLLLEKVKDPTVREWYAQASFEHGWSRNVLAMQIESRLYDRQGKAATNFSRTLPPPQSDLAQAMLKDPYHFQFLTLGDDVHEREIERGLIEHIRMFLLEMGAGFAFVGSQYPMEVGQLPSRKRDGLSLVRRPRRYAG